MFIFEYEVTYYEDLEKKIIKDYGYVIGSDLSSAAENISYYFGEINIIDITLRPISDSEVYSLNQPNNDYEPQFKLENKKI